MLGTTTILILLAFALLGLALKKYLSRKDNFWIDRGVHNIKLDGKISFFKRITLQVSFTEVFQQIYQKFGDHKYGGYVDLGTPTLVIKDLDLLKRILVKDFDHFINRSTVDLNDSDKILSRMMTSLKGKEWKDLRSVMSPTFTTGRIRRMFKLFNLSGQKLVTFMKEQETSDKENRDTIDMQDCLGRFTMATISSVAFGLETDTFSEDSVFTKMVKRFQNFNLLSMLKFVVFFLFPKVGKLLRISISDKESMDFFSSVIRTNIEERRRLELQANKSDGGKVKEARQDFLQLMLEAQKGQLKVDEKVDELDDCEKDALIADNTDTVSKKEYSVILDDLTIIAQSVLFFSAGSDPLGSLLTFAAYSLALNPEIQGKLAEEVSTIMQENEGELTYDMVQQMHYLDMVINETLRMYPPAIAADRKCTADYTIPDTNIVIPKGTMINIPITGIHHDPKYYPEPFKFNPENFSPQNKAKRHPYAFIPFGQGPRNCIAMRFALTEAKAAIAHLVYNFTFEPCDKTQIPIVFSKKSFITKPENGLWLKFKSREVNNL